MNCSECQPLLADYALDALEPETRQQVRAHLDAGCVACQSELNATEATLAQLPLLLDPQPPPARAKERLMGRVGAARQAAPMRISSNAEPEPRRWRIRWAEPLAAAAAVAAVFFWLKIDRQQDQIAGLRDEISRQEARVDQLQASLDREGNTIRLFASPAVQLVMLHGSGDQPGAAARVFWDRGRDTFHVYASGLKPLPAGRAYELWFINADQKKIPAGTFSAGAKGEATLVATPPLDAGKVAAIAVTDEPAGGSPQPTGQIQLVGQPS